MAVPFRRTSKTKKRMRRNVNYKITENSTVKCPKCGEAIRPHRVCSNCGTYKGKTVVETESAE